MSEVLHQLFSFVCGQTNCWYLAGESLPVCQRCLGLYIGSDVALVCWFAFRPKPTARVLWAHGVFLLAMIPFGYHLVPQNGQLRTITGWLFAFGLVYYMSTFARPFSRANETWRGLAYFTSVGVGIVALLLAVRYGGVLTLYVLSICAVAGLLTLVAFVTFTFGALARGVIRRVSHA